MHVFFLHQHILLGCFFFCGFSHFLPFWQTYWFIGWKMCVYTAAKTIRRKRSVITHPADLRGPVTSQRHCLILSFIHLQEFPAFISQKRSLTWCQCRVTWSLAIHILCKSHFSRFLRFHVNTEMDLGCDVCKNICYWKVLQHVTLYDLWMWKV